MAEDDGLLDHYSPRRGHGDHHHHHHHHQYSHTNGTAGGHGGARDSEVIGDDGAVHISHRLSGINFTPTLHDSLVNEIRKLRNKLDKRENEVKSLNEELDILRESHDNLQETHNSLASSSSRDIRSLRTQLERNAAAHVSEVKSLRSELQGATSIVHDLRSKLDNARRAKSTAEEQRDKWKSELDDLKLQSNTAKADFERRITRESDKVKVLEDLVSKMEAEIERTTMSVKSGSDGMSLDIHRDDMDEEDDDDEGVSTSGKHNDPGSPVQTLFAEMASMEQVEESDEEEEEITGQFSSPQSPVSSVSLPSISVSQVLQTLREPVEIETVERGTQTEILQLVPVIRVLSPTPPLTNAPLIAPYDTETIEHSTQTEIFTTSQSVQTDPAIVVSPLFKPAPQLAPPPVKSPILRPENSIRRGSHSVRWREEKSIQTEPERLKSVESATQTDPLIIAKVLKPVLKTPTSEVKESEKERMARQGHVKSYDGPSRKQSPTKSGSRRLESHRSSVLFGNSGPPSHIHGYVKHERGSSGSSLLYSVQHGRKNVSPTTSQSDLRRGRQPHPSGMKSRPNNSRSAPGMQLHTPSGMLNNNVHPPLPIPQRSSSKFRVVLPIVRDRPGTEDSLPEVAEEVEAQDSVDEEERARQELNAFLARPPRKTVRQIKSAINLRSAASNDALHPPTPERYPPEPSPYTPSHVELAPKSFSTPRRPPKRIVKLRPAFQETSANNVSPSSSYFPTSEEMSVVDEIARCMVGEYMYKYVRRRRRGSFTWRRSPARQPNYQDDIEESTIRHKRWVYLQPYEKMIMWSPSQPSQSNFLQRAQIKKRVVTGVIDVKDDTPLMISPSSSQLTTPVHNRSIVVLTPTQAIKFTALTRERHISWLTALNFLVHNDPADLIIPRGISTSPSNNSLWAREPVYPTSGTASSIASSSITAHLHGPNLHANFGSFTVRKNSLPDFVPIHPPREDTSPLGHKHRYDDTYAIPPSVPRIPTGRRFDGGRERSGSGSGTRDWEDPNWPGGNRETIRMNAFVKRTAPRLEVDIDDNLFREF